MRFKFFLYAIMEFILIAAYEEERFFWANDYVGKPVNFYHGAAYQIPVIEDEIVEIQCKVRAVSEDSYTIIWDYEHFHANTTGKTVLVNNTNGDEYAQDTITVNIDNPADIDDKDIICSWENGQFSDTITLQFKVYVPESLDISDNDTCEGDVELKLKRPEIQKKEDTNMEEKIKQKVRRRYNVSDVFIDSEGYIHGCKPSPITNNTTTSTEPPPTTTNSNNTNYNNRDLLKIIAIVSISIYCIALTLFFKYHQEMSNISLILKDKVFRWLFSNEKRFSEIPEIECSEHTAESINTCCGWCRQTEIQQTGHEDLYGSEMVSLRSPEVETTLTNANHKYI